MSKTKIEQLYQCRLTHGSSTTTAWIPTRGARQGAYVQLLPSKELWYVDQVFTEHPLPEDVLKEHQKLNRKSLPSIDPIGG
jgi:hypothetical protein